MRKSCLLVVVICFILFLSFQTPAEAANKTKLILGSVLLAGGAALSIHAAETSVLDDSGDTEFYTGIALGGAGATFLVIGLLQNNKNDMSQKLMVPNKKSWELGFAPRRGGFSAGISLRW